MLGGVLYVTALVLDPSMLWRAPLEGMGLLRRADTAWLGLAILLAVSANLALLIRLPPRVRMLYILAPWCPLLAAISKYAVTMTLVIHRAPSFLPWAAGTSALLAARAGWEQHETHRVRARGGQSH